MSIFQKRNIYNKVTQTATVNNNNNNNNSSRRATELVTSDKGKTHEAKQNY